MKRIALVGGPNSGKSTILKMLQNIFPDFVYIPEIATIILQAGFYEFGVRVGFSPDWRVLLQKAIYAAQISFEDAGAMQDARFQICDRGLGDIPAYLPGGEKQYREEFGSTAAAFRRYDYVFHLESLATANPTLYGKLNNSHRREGIEEAVQLEMKTRTIWSEYCKNRFAFIDGKQGLDHSLNEVVKLIRSL